MEFLSPPPHPNPTPLLGIYSLLKKTFIFYHQFNYLTAILKGEETNISILRALSPPSWKQQNKTNKILAFTC